jgi:hypothetical protein
MLQSNSNVLFILLIVNFSFPVKIGYSIEFEKVEFLSELVTVLSFSM